MGSHRAGRSRRDCALPVARLARFVGTTLTDPVVFGGGATEAQVRQRVLAVAYGYPAVVDSYFWPDGAAIWSTLTVALPCGVPAVTIDHRCALGLPGVPFSGGHAIRAGPPAFDEQYLVAAADPVAAANLFTAGLCDVLLRQPVQRLSFEGARLFIRTFDGFEATPEVVEWLDGLAASVLATTPAFVTRVTASNDSASTAQTFPPGLHGPDDPDDLRPDGLLSGRFAFPARRRAF